MLRDLEQTSKLPSKSANHIMSLPFLKPCMMIRRTEIKSRSSPSLITPSKIRPLFLPGMCPGLFLSCVSSLSMRPSNTLLSPQAFPPTLSSWRNHLPQISTVPFLHYGQYLKYHTFQKIASTSSFPFP